MLPTLCFYGEIRWSDLLENFRGFFPSPCACASIYSLSFEHNCLHPGLAFLKGGAGEGPQNRGLPHNTGST